MNAVFVLSAGLPVCNGETDLVESLDARLGQSYRGIGLIISDKAGPTARRSLCRH